MAVITSNTTLETAIGDYLARSDLSTFIPNFVQNAENKLYRTLNLRNEETALYVRVIDGVARIPARFKSLKYAYFDGSPTQPLEWVTAQEIYRRFPTRTTSSTPRLIAKEGENFIFGPGAKDGVLRGMYYRKPHAARDAVENLLLQSENLSTSWTLTRATSSQNADVDPNFGHDANTLDEDGTASNNHLANQTFTANNDTTYTFSGYFKELNRPGVLLQILNQAGTLINARFDLNAGTIIDTSSADSDPVPAFIEKRPDDWYRCGITANVGSAGASEAVQVSILDSSGSNTFDGLSQQSIYVWGLQLETGDTPGKYVKTTTAAATAENWYLINAPEVLLYGALLEAAPFIRDDARLPVWRELYQEAIATLRSEDYNAEYQKGSLAMQAPKVI